MHRCKSSHWCSWFAKIHLQLLSVNAAPGESKSQFYSYCKFQKYMDLGLYNISLVLFGQNKTLPKKHTNEDDNCHRSVMKGHHCLCDFNNEKKPMNEIESWWLIEKKRLKQVMQRSQFYWTWFTVYEIRTTWWFSIKLDIITSNSFIIIIWCCWLLLLLLFIVFLLAGLLYHAYSCSKFVTDSVVVYVCCCFLRLHSNGNRALTAHWASVRQSDCKR